MPKSAREVAELVAQGLAAIADERVAAALRRHLVPPQECLLDWDYGDRHPAFREPRYPGFIVAVLDTSGNAIAYSEYGFGPGDPWGLVGVPNPGFGMDCGWFRTLEDAFRDSVAWDEPRAPGDEVQ